jgi:hypothetical protein
MMKKHRISILLTILSVFSLFLSCSKDNTDDSSQLYRVSEIINNFNDGTYDSTRLIYDGERIASLYIYSNSVMGVDEAKLEISYPDDNNIIKAYYSKDGLGNWVMYSKLKTEQFRQGDVKTVKVYAEQNQTWNLVAHTIITYTGFVPEKFEQTFFNEVGDTIQEMIESCSYQNDRILEATVSIRNHNEWYYLFKQVATYNGSQIESIIRQHYDSLTMQWENKYRNFYTYGNGQLKKKEQQYFVQGMWADNGILREFDYDSEGKLTGEHAMLNESEAYKTYRYEKGKGNYEVLFINDSYSMESQVEPIASSVRPVKDYFQGVQTGKVYRK